MNIMTSSETEKERIVGRKKRTITVNETATLLLLRLKSKETQQNWCSECESEVLWIDLHTAVELFGMTNLSKKCVVHLNEGRVCSRSLMDQIKTTRKSKGRT